MPFSISTNITIKARFRSLSSMESIHGMTSLKVTDPAAPPGTHIQLRVGKFITDRSIAVPTIPPLSHGAVEPQDDDLHALFSRSPSLHLRTRWRFGTR